MFEFKDCSIYRNLSKSEIIDKLEDLKDRADSFERKTKSAHSDKETKKVLIKEETTRLFDVYTRGENDELSFEKAYELLQELHKKTGTRAQTKQDFT